MTDPFPAGGGPCTARRATRLLSPHPTDQRGESTAAASSHAQARAAAPASSQRPAGAPTASPPRLGRARRRQRQGRPRSSVRGGGRAEPLLPPPRAALPEEAGPRRATQPGQHLLPAPGSGPAPEAEAAAEAAAEALRRPRGAKRKLGRGAARRSGAERAPCRAERAARRSR